MKLLRQKFNVSIIIEVNPMSLYSLTSHQLYTDI